MQPASPDCAHPKGTADVPKTEWIGFAAEMVVLIGGLTAIGVWMETASMT